MNPIRYRGWHFNRKQMFSTEELVRDQMTILADGRFINVSSEHTSLSRIFEPSEFLPLLSTGIADKNGVEIFQGDIVAAPFANGSMRKDKRRKVFNVEVKITPENGATFSMPPAAWIGDYRWHPPLTECEVIGNIYQHPELLERQ